MALNEIEKREYLRIMDMNKRKILSFFPKGKKKGLRFTDIKNFLDLNQRKTTQLLKSLIEEGFLEKKKVNGKNELYFNKFSEYRGDFDIWDLMSKIDKISQKKGRVLNEEMGWISGVCSILAYGSLPYEKLTPIEKEMLFLIMSKIRDAFLDYRTLADSIEFRRLLERESKLPKTCKDRIFGDKSSIVDIASMDKIYGDSLWSYFFEYYVRIFHTQLTRGYMDVHGLKDLFNILESIRKTIDVEVEKKGPWNAKDYSETELSKSIPPMSLVKPFFADDINSNAFGIMITPSPRALRDYADQVGNIVKQQIDIWKDFENTLTKTEKDHYDWNEIVSGILIQRKRSDHLKVGIVEGLLFRGKKLSKKEEMIMRNDPLLKEILTKNEITWIINKSHEVYSRCHYFRKKFDKKEKLSSIKNNSKWFTKNEIRDYKPVQNFVGGLRLKEDVRSNKKTETRERFDFNSDTMIEMIKGLEDSKKKFIRKSLKKKNK